MNAPVPATAGSSWRTGKPMRIVDLSFAIRPHNVPQEMPREFAAAILSLIPPRADRGLT